ncbi:uncharacterized protein [Nicotiana sylvestris]|uniref:uncharacterized protein n=1 Tax=Nicotiana sylvestris TaxID=4096 RepID=UPI00388CDAEE
MAYFSQSLSDAALEWYTHQDYSRWYTWDDLSQAFTRYFQYNIEIVPDRLSLNKIEKKPIESFREYGFGWREQAARVNLPMKENEMVEYFLQALEPTYFGHLISAIGKSFNEVVKKGDMVEEGIKSRKTTSYSTIKTTTHAIQNGIGGVIGKKKKEDVATVDSRSRFGTRELIDTNQIEVQTPEAPNINQNPLPTHEETNMIEIVHRGEPKKPSQSVIMIRSSEVKPVKKPTVGGSVNKLSMTNGGPSVVVDKRSPSDVVAKQEKSKVVVPGLANKPIIIVEGSRIDPVIIKLVTQLSVINTKAIPWNYERVIVTYKGKELKEEVNEDQDEHRRTLMKILNKAHVPDKISVNHLEKITNKIFEVNRITFSDDKLPVEGTEHNKALYLTVKCKDSVVTRVLVDSRSSANIFPLSSLNKLKVDDERIHKNNICVRDFDGGGKDSVGDIVLELTIGPIKFTMEFQEIVVHGKENLCAHSDASIPFIEAEDDKGPWVYQVFETVSVEKFPEGKCIQTPKITSASVVVASEMLKNGIVPELIEWFQRLFDDVNMVEFGEGTSKADVQFIGPNVKLNNWKATPLPNRKESC